MAERAPVYLACDLGAESGRVVAGSVDDDGVALRELHRFANVPVRLPGGLHWNLQSTLRELLDGIAKAAGGTPLAGIGIDAWGVDYGLLDGEGRLLGLPAHYRDTRTAGMVERAERRVPREQMYAATGIQTMPINTVYQLLADEGTAAMGAAERLALVPDLLALWLCGEASNERTVASTTGLLDARGGDWAWPLIDRLGLPRRLFHELTDPGTQLGPLLDHHAQASGVEGEVPVLAVAGHDTASAFVAAATADDTAVLSSGTWSLLGVELRQPVLSDRAREWNFTNERGLDGTTRLLRNVMGLWLLQECRAAWDGAPTYAELERLAAAAAPDVPLFDPDLDELLAPGAMPERIAAACARLGQDAPRDPGEYVRSILSSLACKYRLVLERLELVSGRRLNAVRVVGGGARNELLCRLSADVLGLPLLAGPAEATALGNVLVQALGRGQLASPAEVRELAATAATARLYEPDPRRAPWDDLYDRFLALTGLAAPATERPATPA